MDYREFALNELKKAGLKITKPRMMTVELLAKSDKALTPYEMREELKKQRINADVVTIYRVLEVLERMLLVHKVMAFGRYIRCSTTEKSKGCHHYLLCKECRKVEEIEGENLHILEEKIQKEKNFTIESHYLEFIGVCALCRGQSSK